MEEFRVGVVGDAAGIVNEVFDGLTIDHFIAHGTVYGTLNSNNFLCDRHKEYVAVLEVVGGTDGGVLHELVDIQTGDLATTGELDGTHRTHGRGTAGCREGIEGGVQGTEGEAALHTHLAVNAHIHSTGRGDSDGNLIGTIGIMLCQLVLDGGATLCQRHAFEENLGGAGRLDAAVGTDALVYLSLRGAKDGDVNLVALAQHVVVGCLSTVGSAEYIEVFTGEEGVSIDVVANRGGDMVFLEGFLEGHFGSGFADGGLRYFCRCLHFIGRRGGGGVAGISFFGLHLIEDGHHTTLIVFILSGRDVVHVNAVFQEAGTHLGLVESSFLQFGLSHGHHAGGGGLCHHCHRQGGEEHQG